ncbi:hypothetical protein EJ377_17920 [Chryseobacterium arthrosphaerae]|uniref:Uncharacterized protein n=1 Tax=Chryseobacterium arthrosphaerae TaxID=651561 RepID=A0A3S0Q4J4_9FLAO|nr:hypothetical protein EJ377_17920 [Chryseobacterium arthrosphaerae]
MKKKLAHTAAVLLAGKLTAEKININIMPKTRSVSVININKLKTLQLDNGFIIMVVENNKLFPLTASLYINNPLYYESNIVGISQMAEQLKNGYSI